MKNREVFGWLIYDFANSAFATTILAGILPLYFVSYVVPHEGISLGLFGLRFKTHASSLWAYSISISTLLVAMFAPVLGTIADLSHTRKKFLFAFCYLGCLCTGLLYFVKRGDYWAAIILFILANIGFEGSNVFYNAFLRSIAQGEIDWISGKGFAYGYLGGGIILAINLLIITKYQWFGLSSKEMGMRVSFLLVGFWWAIFSIPTFFLLKEHGNVSIPLRKEVYQGFLTIFKIIKRLSQHRQATRFLIAFLIYNEGIQTVIVIAIVFGAVELLLKESTLIGILLMVQFIGIPGTLFFGKLARRIGAKATLLIILNIWVLVTIYAFFMKGEIGFWALGIIIGLILGGSQALSRSLYAMLIPSGHESEFFGFFAISQKFSAILGPLGFGIIRDITGSLRYSIIFLASLFLIGMLILNKIELRRP